MEVERIILYKNKACPFCNELNAYIPEILNELGTEGVLFVVIDITEIENEAVKEAMGERGVPFVEFRNSKDEIIYTFGGKPTVDYDKLKEGFPNIDTITIEDKAEFEFITEKQIFMVELINANITELDKKYHNKENLKEIMQTQTEEIMVKVRELNTNAMAILDKYK